MDENCVGVSRSRKMCSKRKQILSYSAYNRHLNPLVCPPPSTTSYGPSVPIPSTASTDTVPETEVTEQEERINDYERIDSSKDGSDEEEDTEVIDAEEESGYEECDSVPDMQGAMMPDSMNLAPNASPPSSIIQYVCHIVSFFQLCYRLSDRAITLLLVFLRGLLLWINSSTMGERNVLILHFGSLGPGIQPTNITFSVLNRSDLGRFSIARYMRPILY